MGRLRKGLRGGWALCGVLILTAMVIVLGDSLRGYATQKPLVIGPLKQGLLLVLFGLLCGVSLFRWQGAGVRTVGAVCCFLAGCIWFAGRSVLAYVRPEVGILPWLDRLAPMGFALLGAGITLALPEGMSPIWVQNRAGLILVTLFLGIALSPVLRTGYCWDDAFFTADIPAMRVRGEPILSRMWGEIVEYGRMGRLNPFATFHFLVFYLIPTPFAYKAFLVFLSLCSAWTFYAFMKKLTGGVSAGLYALLGLGICFQLRLYNDPLTGYYGLMQVMFCELMLSACFFLDYLEGKRGALFCSLFLFLLGLLSYEMFFPFAGFFLLLACVRSRNVGRGILKSLPHCLLAVGVFAVSMFFRSRNITEATAYNGTTFRLDIQSILRTWWYQISGAFPFSYALAGNDASLPGRLIPYRNLFVTGLSGFLKGIRWEDCVALAAAGLVFTGVPKEGRKIRLEEAVTGICLLMLPGLVLSLSEKYQRDLTAGLAYIPVYLSYFGAAIFLRMLVSLRGRYVSRVLVGVFAALFLLNQQNNRIAAGYLNESFLYPRMTGEQALSAGLLGADWPEDGLIISNNPYSLWEHGWQKEPYQSAFYTSNAGVPIQAMSAEDYIRSQDKVHRGLYYPQNARLVAYGGNESNGFAKSGRIRETRMNHDAGTLYDTLVTDVIVYVRGYEGMNPAVSYELRDGTVRQIPLEENWLLKETAEGRTYKVQENSVIRFDSIGVVTYQ